jgi:hypothetical protein
MFCIVPPDCSKFNTQYSNRYFVTQPTDQDEMEGQMAVFGFVGAQFLPHGREQQTRVERLFKSTHDSLKARKQSRVQQGRQPTKPYRQKTSVSSIRRAHCSPEQ